MKIASPVRSARWIAVSAVVVLGAVLLAGEAPKEAGGRRTEKEALAEFNSLIGEWRGVGQPRRNSNAGAWSERAEWTWEFKEGTTGLRYTTEQSKLIRSALLTWDAEESIYRLTASFADKTERRYEGRLDDGRLALDSEPDTEGQIHRLTITPLSQKRLLVLHEKRREGSSFGTRIAEIGYTRSGTRLAVEGSDGPECIVTGGLGTIKVAHKGETYYVCCTGCRQAFEDDPEGTIAEYKQRLAERKEKK